MDNFFGLGTANSAYDKRRHVNLVYYTMMMLRFTKKDNSFMMNLKQILSSGYDKNTKSDLICQHILTDLEISYLNYLRTRYGLNEEEYITILAGESLGQGQVKSPAGYHGTQNWEMIVQMFYATMLSGPAYQGYVQQLVSSFFYPFCSGMRDVTLQSSTFRLISENMNKCLDQGKRLFTDLPYIEQYVIRAIL
jgi:hypothetical protein